LAGIINGISAIHAAYLDAGGLGLLVGDGQLPHPGPEQIIEAYYSAPGALIFPARKQRGRQES
jgi:high affinity Mn2+ porin